MASSTTNKTKRRPSPARRIGGAIALTAVAGAAIAGGMLWSQVNNMGGAGGASSVIASFRNPKAQFPGKSRIYVLLLGRDYDRDRKGMPYTKSSRSDSIMMLSLDLDSQKVSALSIPRDTHIAGGSKINAALARGGPQASSKAVADLLGVAPDHYIVLKPDAVKAMVDALGGVEVETLDTMDYDDYWGQFHVHLPKGRQVVDGSKAVQFARYREPSVNEYKPDGTPVLDSNNKPVRKKHVVGSKEDGDPRRMARQQQLIRAMTAKGKSFSNLFQVDKIVNTAFSQVETDLSRQQVFALVALFRSIQPDQMQTATLEGKGGLIGRSYYFIPNEQKKKALVEWILKGDEAAANRLTVVAVTNGTDVAGAASRVASLLKQQGFDAKNAGNAPSPAQGAAAGGEVTATRIVYGKASVAARAQRIAQLLGGGQVVKEVTVTPAGDEDKAADVTVILGRDLAPGFAPQKSAKL